MPAGFHGQASTESVAIQKRTAEGSRYRPVRRWDNWREHDVSWNQACFSSCQDYMRSKSMLERSNDSLSVTRHVHFGSSSVRMSFTISTCCFHTNPGLFIINICVSKDLSRWLIYRLHFSWNAEDAKTIKKEGNSNVLRYRSFVLTWNSRLEKESPNGRVYICLPTRSH